MKSIQRLNCVVALAIALALAPQAEGAAPPVAPHYRVDAQLDPGHGALSATVVIRLPAAAARAGAGFLLPRGYRISSATAGDNADVTVADVEQPFPGLQRVYVRARPGAPGAVELRIVYAGPLFAPGASPVNAISPERIELSADSLWYPLSDNFNQRFTMDATITGVPSTFTVASADTVKPAPNGFLLHRSQPRQDIAFTASPLARRKVVGRLVFVGQTLESAQARAYLLNGPKALAFLERMLGPTPGGKAIVSVVSRANGTGYSRQGYVVVADLGAATPTGVWPQAGYLAHELSHAWWSNADFLGEDYWLVESTAEYVALRFLEAEFGAASIQPLIENKTARAAKAGPVIGRGRGSSDAVYASGTLLLIDLEHRIGRSRLDRILRRLASRPQLTTRDFLVELEREAGGAVAADFEAALRR